jgi:hypothetical protein
MPTLHSDHPKQYLQFILSRKIIVFILFLGLKIKTVLSEFFASKIFSNLWFLLNPYSAEKCCGASCVPLLV